MLAAAVVVAGGDEYVAADYEKAGAASDVAVAVPTTTTAAVIKTALESRIKNLVGISAKVSVLMPGAIERTQTGKSRRVIDKRATT